MNQYDVIVVGGGGSGLAAALSVAQQGGQVLVLEKQPQIGGTTGIAVGSFTAAETSLQRDAGINDCVDDHVDDLAQFANAEIEDRNAAEMRAYFLNHAAATFEWLRELGLMFVGPSPEPPNRRPRMHNVVPGAKAYIAVLQTRLLQWGGQIVCNAAVRELLQESGRVVGVRVTIDSEDKTIRADRGVVLAAGDYSANSRLIAEHKGSQFASIEGINSHAGGDGHLLAAESGAKLVNMDVTYGPELRFVTSSKQPFQQWLPATGPTARLMGRLAGRLPKWVMRSMIKRLLVTWQHPENALFDDGAILLNRQGNRFVDEKRAPEREIAVAEQPDKLAYILLDGRLVERYSAWPHFISTAPDIAYAYVADYQRLRPDVTVSGATIDQVCLEASIDSKTVRASVDQFNRYVSGQSRDPYKRTGDKFLLQSGPWVLLGPVKAYFTTTEGGAVVDQRMRVLNEKFEPIPGLYAVGQNGLSGMILWSHGLHIAWALTSGRLAGQSIMCKSENVPPTPTLRPQHRRS